MITTSIYHDARRCAPGHPCAIKLVICNYRQRAYINTGISVTTDQWDKIRLKVVGHSHRNAYNTTLTTLLADINQALVELQRSGKISRRNTAMEIRDIVEAYLHGDEAEANELLFAHRLNMYVARFTRPNTIRLYRATEKMMREYDRGYDGLLITDITYDWLVGFDRFMMPRSPGCNARNIHFRNIRAVINDAIDDEVTTHYPFRRFKIKPQPTRKRSLSVEAIRKIFNAEGLEPWQEKYRDFFKLTFMLIGINVIDLCSLRTYENGRIEYTRAKTNKPYSIKVEPEADEIIRRYRGEKNLLNFLDTYQNYRSFYMNMSNGLNAIRQRLNDINDGVPITGLTSYWARHTWATIAAELDIPKDVIALALGHGGNSVTDIYIRYDLRKVDEANRRVIDYVLYNIR